MPDDELLYLKKELKFAQKRFEDLPAQYNQKVDPKDTKKNSEIG